jgi:tetratricopeptide (TPR) repeat protein
LSAKWKHGTARTPNLSRLQRQAGMSFHEGDLGKAERLCEAILQHRSDDFDALQLLGLLKLQRRQAVEALRFLSTALKVNSTSAEAMSNLGLALHALTRFEDAAAQFRNALLIAPDHPEILYNLGNACLELGKTDEALAIYEQVLAQNPDHAGALVNAGNALVRLNRPAEAILSYDNALAALPGHPQILTNRGHARRRLDRPAEALADFKAALTGAPEFAEAHFEAGMAHLTLGDFASGWKEYEWRWKTGTFADRRRQFRAPLWLGDTRLCGKTILLHAEQGFGDTIQFIRYAPLIARGGAKVICEVQGELRSLLSQFDGIEVFAEGEPLPAFDVHCPLLSLPLACGTRLETTPAPVAYLAASAECLDRWRDRVPRDRRSVGFVWSGSSSHRNDANRSIPLSKLAALLKDAPVRCFSLQNELRKEDREILAELPELVHFGSELREFADTAAVISQLDLVISVDTAVAHLAGALGKPVIILLPYAADFRWMRDRDYTPWYPTARLFRQPAFGDWDSVIARLQGELRRLSNSIFQRSGSRFA